MSIAPHKPVMLDEAVSALSVRGGGLYIDGTFGAGGYSRAILACEGAGVIAIDRDPNVQKTAKQFEHEFGSRFELYQGAFSQMEQAANDRGIDGVVLDIGVSSMQLDQAERGFSFMREGPLDMRMASSGASAADAVNHMSASDLTRIFQVYGEERRARRCADFILRAREEAPLTTTAQLAEVIGSALGRGGKIHPATRVFQALRIFVNDELGELYRALVAAEKVLVPGGKLAIVTFHSLEDKIVKSYFRSRAGETRGQSRHLPPEAEAKFKPSLELGYRSAVKPSREEVSTNPRARSAKLRVATRTHTPIWDMEDNLLPRVPSLYDLQRVAS